MGLALRSPLRRYARKASLPPVMLATWPTNPRFFACAIAFASERGRLDVLIDNAGGWRYENIREVTLANWDWTFRVNLLSMFIASRACMDMMIERRYGRIVNISSTDGYRAKPTLPVYAAARGGGGQPDAHFCRTRAASGHRQCGRAWCDCDRDGEVAELAGAAHPTIPVRRAAEPEDIAEVVLFLASPANGYVVGECVIANGGALMA